jgi:hypothetical protein
VAGASSVAGEISGSAWDAHRSVSRFSGERDFAGLIERKISIGFFG